MGRQEAIDPAGINVLNDDPGEDILWTRVNVGEAIPGAVTPLTAEFQRPANTWPAGRMFHRMGLLPTPDIPGVADERSGTTRFFCAQVAISLDFLRWLADRTPGTSGDAFEASILGSVRPGVVSKPDKSRFLIAAAKLIRLIAVLPQENARLLAGTSDWWRASIAKAERASEEEAAALFDDARQRYEHIIDHAGLVAILSPAALDQIARPLKRMGAAEETLSVAAGYGSVKETDMLERLWAVAHGLMRMPLFLSDYGYMCPSGGELESLSWREDPAALEPMIEVFRASAREMSPRAKLERVIASAAAKRRALLERARGAGRLELQFGFWLANRLLPLRENGKAAMFMASDAARAAARRLGECLTARRMIDTAEDVFYLTHDEVLRRGGDLKTSVRIRRKLRETYAAIELPDFFTSAELREIIRAAASAPAEPKAAPSADTAEAAPAAAFTITGAAASAGHVTARARVIRDPRKAEGFRRGDILVCHVTDPGWTALLSIAGGMIVDIGGMLSHTAIVARELGVPAIVNTRDGTKRIPDGAEVTLDGAAGTATVHGRRAAA